MQNIHTIEADIKHKNSIYEPTLTSNDDVVFIVKVTDDENPVPMDLVTTALLANTRGDRQTVLTPGSIEADGTIRFELGTSETAIPGQVKAVVQLYDGAGERVSTIDFSYKVLRDPTGEGYIPSENERTLIEVVLEDGPGIMAAVQQATEQAVAITQATEAERVATQEERLMTRGIRENMELVRQATITVKNDTEAVQLATEQVRKNTEAERLATEGVKKATDIVRADTEKARNAANVAAEETQQVKAETAVVRDATQKVQDATVLVKNQTQAVKESTETVRLETAQVRDETNLAKAATIKATSEAVQATEQSVAVTQSASQALATFETDAGNALQAFGQQSASDLKEFDTASRTALETFDSQAVNIVYEAQQATVKANEAAAGTQSASDYATRQGNFALQVAEANRTKWLPPVATFAELATKYPTPSEGDTIRVTGETRVYRYSSGAWIVTDIYTPTAIDDLASKVNESTRQTQLIQNGVNILNADVATPVDFEIQGRTLTSLANTNLEQLKYYALADKKTKIIVDNTTIAGIGKFQKKSTTLTIADFVGKVSGSTVANPHLFRHRHSYPTLEPPSTAALVESNWYPSFIKLDGVLATTGLVAFAGQLAQQLFSFNIVEQIERQLGLIPKATLADKVAWVKDNADLIRSNWHGFGSSVGGNKATSAIWNSRDSIWYAQKTHTSNVVSLIRQSLIPNDIKIAMDNNGFVHFLAYAEPSDGVTASTINTDFINLEIELKATAQLNTRGKIIRAENFEVKQSGSTVENPHKFSRQAGTVLAAPNAANWYERDNNAMLNISTLNNAIDQSSHSTSGYIAQQLFSFNLIEAIERNVGKIPASDTAGKAAWVRNNIVKYTGKWTGFGSSVGGNKATFTAWLSSDRWWDGDSSHTASVPAIKTLPVASNNVQNDGFVHFLAYANASDGVTASTINTDYVELEIELKQDANFANPKVPLYEVTKEEFDKIGVNWTDEETLKRFPVVEGTQHLLNPYVMAEGENLIPPFTEWTLSANARIVSPYEMELQQKSQYEVNSIRIPIQESTSYYFGRSTLEGRYWGWWVNKEGVNLGSSFLIVQTTNSAVIKPPVGAAFIDLRFDNLTNVVDKVITSQPILTPGTTAKPFTPRNPSYLYAETKLGAIGDRKDVLYRQDGQWKRRKLVEKDVILEGFAVNYSTADIPGSKGMYLTGILNQDVSMANAVGNAHNGESIYPYVGGGVWKENGFRFGASNKVLYGSIPDRLTGFSASYVPTSSDWKRYFNGWKYTDGVTWTSVTGNGQTATAQQALDTKPTDYTPYKLSYVLANPVIENVNVDGDIVANGLTQLEIGAGFSFTEVNGRRTYTRTPASQRPKLTANPVDMKAVYAKNIRSAVDDLADRFSDLASISDVTVRAIAELYKRVKALGG